MEKINNAYCTYATGNMAALQGTMNTLLCIEGHLENKIIAAKCLSRAVDAQIQPSDLRYVAIENFDNDSIEIGTAAVLSMGDGHILVQSYEGLGAFLIIHPKRR